MHREMDFLELPFVLPESFRPSRFRISDERGRNMLNFKDHQRFPAAIVDDIEEPEARSPIQRIAHEVS
jgi:hypothetical protein